MFPHLTVSENIALSLENGAKRWWLGTGPRIMIFDEPTQGVDVGSKAEIHDLIMQLAERGMAVIPISSELPELLAMSDRVGVFRAGTLAGVLEGKELTQKRVMTLRSDHRDAAVVA